MSKDEIRAQHVAGAVRNDALLQARAKSRLRKLIQDGLASGPGRAFTPEIAAELRKRALGGQT